MPTLSVLGTKNRPWVTSAVWCAMHAPGSARDDAVPHVMMLCVDFVVSVAFDTTRAFVVSSELEVRFSSCLLRGMHQIVTHTDLTCLYDTFESMIETICMRAKHVIFEGKRTFV